MVNILYTTTLRFRAHVIEWAPKNWSNRKAWGSVENDKLYITRSGDIYWVAETVVLFITNIDSDASYNTPLGH